MSRFEESLAIANMKLNDGVATLHLRWVDLVYWRLMGEKSRKNHS